MIRLIVLSSVVLELCACSGASAQSFPDVPGDDIFGFTTPTDVGKPGDSGITSENNGRAGKRENRFLAITSKTEFSRTLDDQTWAAFSFFNSYYRSTGIPDLDRNLLAFDGLSFELERRVVARSAENPFALSVSVEPRWARLDGSGQRAEALGAEMKVFVDAVVIPDKLYWAMNLNYLPGVQRDSSVDGRWRAASGTSVSSALTYAWASNLFIGIEARHLATFDDALPRKLAGAAVFFGPNMLWKVTDKVALNFAWTPQITGQAQVNKDSPLDLDNFERHLFRVKLAVQF